MNYKAEKTEKNQLRVTIELNKAEWTESNKAAYEKNKAKYSAPGFRKGHVPYSYLVNAYGEQIFFEDAINDAFSKHYFSILDKEAEYKVIDGPSIEDIKPVKDGGMVIIALAPLKPDVKLGAYKGIKIEKVEYNVTDEDVDKEVEKLRERNAREIEVTDRAVMDGDIVDIDYSGSVDNEKFEGGTAEHQTLVIGSKTFIPGFEDQIIGMNIGGERDITVKFPDDYGAENLKGKVAVFAIKLHGIKVKELPELTDEFVKEKTGSETVDAYKASVKEKLEKANAQRAEREIEDKIIKAITDKSEVEIPDSLVEREIDNMVQQASYRLMYQGLKFEDYLKYTNQTMEAYREGLKDSAKDHVKTQLVIDKILTDEKIEATKEDVDAKIAEQAQSVGKDAVEYAKTMSDKQRGYIENGVVIDKLFKFLKENNTIA